MNIGEDDLDFEFIPLTNYINRLDRGVRLIHKPTGITVECTTNISVMDNYTICMRKMYRALNKIKI